MIQIGQAVKDAQAEGLELPRLAPETPWQAIAGMRDRLAHKYWQQDTNLVWAVVERDLPELRKSIGKILRSTSRQVEASYDFYLSERPMKSPDRMRAVEIAKPGAADVLTPAERP